MSKMGFRAVRVALLAVGVLATATTVAPGGAHVVQAASHGGVLNVSYTGRPANMDPHLTTDPTLATLLPVYDRLVQYDLDGNLVPMLATEWHFMDDWQSLVLELRQDVTFHDGTPFNADAVVKNLERVRDNPASYRAADLTNTTGFEAVDEFTVKLGLKAHTGASLLAAFAGQTGMMVSPKVIDSGGDFSTDPSIQAGSGPYVVTDLDPQGYVRYERVPNHWDTTASTVRAITITTVVEPTTHMNSVQTGEMQLAQLTGAAASAAIDRAANGDFNIMMVPVRYATSIQFNNSGVFANQDLRQAIAYAIDRQSISQYLYNGTCRPSPMGYGENHWLWDDSMAEEPLPFDLAKSHASLEAAGLPDGFKLTLNVGQGGSARLVMPVLQAQLEDAGFDVEVNTQDDYQLFNAFIAGDVDNQTQNIFAYLEPMNFFNEYLLDPDRYEFAGDQRSDFDFVRAAEDPALSQDQRADIFRRGLRLAVERAYVIPLCSPDMAWIHQDGLQGLENVVGLSDGSPDLSRQLSMAG